MKIAALFLSPKTMRALSFIILSCILIVFGPAVSLAQDAALVVSDTETVFAPDPGASAQCAAFPYSSVKPCISTTFFGLYTTAGICTGPGVCTATAITPMATVGIGAISSVINGVVQIGIRAFSGGGTTGSSYPTTATSPYGCTGTRYISPTPTADPCGVYIPTTPTTNPSLGLTPPPGSGTTTGGPTTATLSVVPTSGPAPLKVTFTVTDTTTSCTHQAVMLSAGDGTDAVVALPAMAACRTLSPVTLTYTYKTAGTYTATITTASNPVCAQPPMPTCPSGLYCAQVMPQPRTYPSLAAMRADNATYVRDGQCEGGATTSASTQQVLQSVTILVGGTATTSNGSASLSVVPTSGPAPLKVTFTVTDTTTSCPRSAILLSAGDGSNPVTALPAAAQCTGTAPAQFSYTYTKAGTYTATLINQDTQQVLQSATVTVGGTASPATDRTMATLSVAPASGPAPLNVSFTVTDISTSCPRSAVVLSAGDGSNSVTALPATITCIGVTPAVLNYTYRNAGTFTVSIGNANTKQVFQTATVTVSPGSTVTATVPPLSVAYTTPTSGTVNVSSSLLNLTNNVAKPHTVPSGTWGDIQADASGVTITAGGHDTDGRTGIGGFYGYDTVPGVQPQDLARQMCAARPWRSSSATATIPPSFYDSICTARGYNAAAVPNSSAPSSAAVKASPKTSAATSTGPAGPVAIIVPAKVYITAVPSSVKIGSRTSIFWNAVGVKSCLVTSPDGSFKENKLSGAASTVALTGETVFSIVCIKPDDSQVSNYARVKIAI